MTEQPPISITRLVLAGTGWMMGWRIISRSLGFVSLLILARLLAPSDFGVVALATSATAAIDSLSQLGVRDALVRLQEDRRDYYDTAFTFQVLRGLVTGVLIAVLSLFSENVLGEPRLQAVLLVLAAVAVVSSWENIGVVRFSREMDFRTQFILQAVPRVLGFAVTTVLAFLMHSYWALVWGAASAKLTGVLLTYVISAHHPSFSLHGWRYLLSFSFWSWGNGLAAVVWTRADPFLLSSALGSTTLGLYMIAGEIALLPVSELIDPASMALFPGFSLAQRNGTDPLKIGLTVSGVLALCAAPFAIGVSACSGLLVAALLGPKWDAAQPVIAILAWLCLFSPFSYVCSSVLSAKGMVARVFLGAAAAAAIKVAAIVLVRSTGNLLLISLVSVFVVAAESSIFVWQLRAAGNRELRWLAMAMLRMAVAVAGTVAVLYVVPMTWQVVPLGQFAALAVGAAVGLLTFVVFFALQGTLWFIFGRPSGPETRLLEAWRGFGLFRRIEDTLATRLRPS